MKILKTILAVLGLVGLIAAGVYLSWFLIDMKEIMGAANANKSQPMTSPVPRVYWLAGLASLGGLLLGMGLALPTRLAGGIRKEALAMAAVERQGTVTEPVVVKDRTLDLDGR